MQTINSNVKKIRQQKKLTQDFVAKKLGVSRVWYNKLENDEVAIKVDILPKLAEIFKVPVQELTQVNDSNYFSTTNNNSQIKNIANVVNDNSEIKELYEKLLNSKNDLLAEKDLRIKNLEERLRQMK
ncbi:MAG: helix-turn-helix transcriptional regulator [Bacteroidia bacterium]|nr:helix-turn-helix transcriptional regulator [Bacteroidia bacterium]